MQIRKITLLLIPSLLWIMSSCVIQEEIHFNKDFSGKVSRSIDLGQIMQMAKSMNPGDSSENPFEQELPENAPGDPGIEGISNFKVKMDPSGKFLMAFEFENLDALNEAYNKLSLDKGMDGMMDGMMGGKSGGFTPGEVPEEEMVEDVEEESDEVVVTEIEEAFTYFRKEGKYLIYRIKTPEADENTPAPEQMQMFEGMGDLFRMTTTISFDRKVKKVSSSSDMLETSSDKQSVTLNMKLNKLQKESEKPEVKIRLK